MQFEAKVTQPFKVKHIVAAMKKKYGSIDLGQLLLR